MLRKYPAHTDPSPNPRSYHTAITRPRPPENPSAAKIPAIFVVFFVRHDDLGILANKAPDTTARRARIDMVPGSPPSTRRRDASYQMPTPSIQGRRWALIRWWWWWCWWWYRTRSLVGCSAVVLGLSVSRSLGLSFSPSLLLSVSRTDDNNNNNNNHASV